jgi:hypothetical protein
MLATLVNPFVLRIVGMVSKLLQLENILTAEVTTFAKSN